MQIEYELRTEILKTLMMRGQWGGRHTSIENALKGIPRHLIGKAKKIVKDLIKEQLLIPKTTHYGFHISLNPKFKKEIENIIETYHTFSEASNS